MNKRHPNPTPPTWRCLAPALSVLALTACAAGPTYQAPDAGTGSIDLLHAGTGQAAEQQPGLTQSAVPEKWWTLFHDPVLDDLESQVADHNLDLLSMAARMEESRAELGIANASRQPQVGLSAGYTRSALSAKTPLHLIGAGTTPYEQWVTGFQASWELDLWGYLKRMSEAAGARFEASQLAVETTRVSVSAELAANYLKLRGIQTQTLLAKQQLETAHHLETLAASRERNGVATKFDTASARAEVAREEANLVQLQHQQNVLMNALAILLGAPPRELNTRLAEHPAMPAMPTDVPVGVSSELAHRRPDILQAEADLHAATAGIGAAKADFYPRIQLSGSMGFAAFNASQLGSWNSRQYSYGPTLYLPIFEGGRLRRMLALSEAREREAAIAYRKTVLSAWHEVDDALDAYSAEKNRHEQLAQAVTQEHQALDVATRNYREGAADYVQVLQAQRGVNAGEAALAQSATLSSLSVVALYKALGGGWNAAPAATTEATTRTGSAEKVAVQ